MSEQGFIGYIQESDVHDGVIITATYKSGFLRSVFDKRVVLVLVLTYDEGLFLIRFSRVCSANITNVEGMRLYSLTEMHERPPFRRFVFVDREEESNRHLEVVAREIRSTEMTEDFVPKEAIVRLRNLFPSRNHNAGSYAVEKSTLPSPYFARSNLRQFKFASQSIPSWNRIVGWLKEMASLRANAA